MYLTARRIKNLKMKNLFALVLFFSCGAAAQTTQCNQKSYNIEIFDSDYSMATTIQYHIFDDSLIIRNIAALVGEYDSCLVARRISENQSEKVFKCLFSMDIMKLKDKYVKPFVQDGDQKIVTICFNNKVKTIQISNIYQKDLADLFDVINQIVDERFKITYSSRWKDN